MKILYINTLYAPYIGGGAEITLQTQVEGMQRAGHEVAVLTIGPEPGLHREEVNGVEVWRAGYRNLYFHHRSAQVSVLRRLLWHVRDRYNRAMQDYVRSVVSEFRPDVASCHNLAGWSVSVWDALTELGVPIVQVLHDQYLLCPKSTMFKRGDRCTGQCAPCKAMRSTHAEKSSQVGAVVGVSQFLRDKIISHGLFSKASTKVYIHNARAMDVATLPEVPRGDDGKIVFGFIGTLAPNKGVELLLQAFLKSAKDNWRLVVAGRGLRDFEDHLHAKYSDSRITYLGHTSQAAFFSRIDATVVPSVWDEPLGMVVAESLMYGRPVLASDRGGIPEMLGPQDGFLFEPSIEAISSAMKSFAATLPLWRSRFSDVQNAGRAFANESAWVARYEELFANACDRSIGVGR